jgi:hypothetical protein
MALRPFGSTACQDACMYILLKYIHSLRPFARSNSYDAAYLRLSVSMTTQSVFKHLLTEGDKFLVSRISPLEDQGAYALASNYGEHLEDGPSASA